MMDAYDIQQELFKAWQSLVQKADATSIKKEWSSVPVLVDGKPVVSVTVKDNSIILETK